MSKNLKERVSKAERLKIWYNDDEVQEIFTHVKQQIHQMWESSASDQEEERERLYRELHGLRAVTARIKQLIEDGIKAEEEIKHGN